MQTQRRNALLCPCFALGLLASLLLLGCSTVGPTGARERPAPDRPVGGSPLDHPPAGYQAGGTLGFALHDTSIQEQLYRRADSAERGLLWSAQFVSRWPLNEDQLDRWSAQVIGLVVDELGADVRLAGWERLEARDIGAQRVAYRYTLTTSSGDDLGEATIVVFARGDQVGLTAAAAIGTRSPIDAAGLARGLNARTQRS